MYVTVMKRIQQYAGTVYDNTQSHLPKVQHSSLTELVILQSFCYGAVIQILSLSLSQWMCLCGWLKGYTRKGHSQGSGRFSWPLFYSLAVAGFPTRSLAFHLSPSALFCRSDMLK